MAGGITDIAKFAGGTALDLGSGIGAASSLGSMFASANPYVAGFQLVTSMFGGSSVKVSKAQTSGNAASGVSDFLNNDKINFNKPMLDLRDPLHVALAGAAVIAVVYVIKKGR